jgi:hypothetical protein
MMFSAWRLHHRQWDGEARNAYRVLMGKSLKSYPTERPRRNGRWMNWLRIIY